MTARDEGRHRLDLPIDIGMLVDAMDDNLDDDAEIAAAGARIAARLLGPDAGVSLLGARQSFLVPGWRVNTLAAAPARESPAERTAQRRLDTELGIEFTRAPAGPERTLITVRSFGSDAVAGDIVRISVRDGGEHLVVLYSADEQALSGQLTTTALTMSEDLEISIMSREALRPDHAAAVTAAVLGSATAGRNAWRRVAKELSVGDPVRAAVLDGLR
ncbi:hypothetical protein FEK33_12405 [Nocardia asteroides NBRC 15531]|uniref:Uncharacterized protein n=1 Tax=Nocardia asteroides NBRC 15531 TaxID=1110697 RepID=U5ED82_NOCAS|nr:hypothetical protein [Nocardia asteroides]TLF66826.1 hypothetical protein FEK33_12405 [Nocardia asteroides NBRC 15531]UGT51929.1 hypothetical protein LT345_15800 [Nocardia asteroides]SFN02108.1 hypothetical protein SAMN05444423_105384 [Nocardia asteroides]VEG35156.1 Uncharacterised protein [Nocardia asteroides]GAD85295.1 hypothetical protein NCAST_30_00650 [Nocardia asteroides NBRC 15531]